MTNQPKPKRRVAVVGSGVAGLACTWALNEHPGPDFENEVHLFEADSRPGGHANTVDFKSKSSGETVRVDTGFIVFNTVTYPNFLLFLQTVNLPYLTSNMSFSVSRDRGLYEWAGGSLSSLFAQKRNIINPSQWRMVWDILRFNAGALTYLKKGDSGESIGDYLRREGFSEGFRDNYLLPMTAAIWSTPPDQAALDFPALTLLTFMHNHHLLQVLDQPNWLTLKDGSHQYVNRIISHLPTQQYHLSTPIKSVSSTGKDGKVELETEKGDKWEFDHVVFACHADTTLEILKKGKGLTRDEETVLNKFEFGKNRAVLHSDPELMPKRKVTWSAWNYLTFSDGDKANVNTVSLTYWMNLLQSIPLKLHGLVAVTLNPPFEPREEHFAGEWKYEHPLFSKASIKAQSELSSIQNLRNLTFCGAWTKYGFHEDGFKSGLSIAVSHLSSQPPFKVQSAERPILISSSDKNLLFFMESLDRVRRVLEVPWSWFMMLVVVVFSVVDVALWVVGAKESQKIVWGIKEKFAESAGKRKEKIL